VQATDVIALWQSEAPKDIADLLSSEVLATLKIGFGARQK